MESHIEVYDLESEFNIEFLEEVEIGLKRDKFNVIEEEEKDQIFMKTCAITICVSAIIFLIVMTCLIFLSIFLPLYFFK